MEFKIPDYLGAECKDLIEKLMVKEEEKRLTLD